MKTSLNHLLTLKKSVESGEPDSEDCARWLSSGIADFLAGNNTLDGALNIKILH